MYQKRALPIFLPIVFLLITLLMSYSSNAEEVLRVGIKPSEPWVMYDIRLAEDKRIPKGFSIDLWNEIAKNLGMKTQWVYHDSTSALVDSASSKKIDVGIAAITVTSEREKQVDFSNSMYETGLQIMVSAKNNSSNPLSVLMKELQKLLSWQVLMGILIMLVITAHLRLWVDRYTHTHFFPQQSYRSGIYETLWWGITMLVTWETPKSRGTARIIDLSWHFMGLIGFEHYDGNCDRRPNLTSH